MEVDSEEALPGGLGLPSPGDDGEGTPEETMSVAQWRGRDSVETAAARWLGLRVRTEDGGEARPGERLGSSVRGSLGEIAVYGLTVWEDLTEVRPDGVKTSKGGGGGSTAGARADTIASVLLFVSDHQLL